MPISIGTAAGAMKLAGVLLVFAWLVMPPVAALFWTEKMSHSLLLALPISLLGSLAGLWVSYGKDYPTGATMVVVFGAIAAASYLLRLLIPERISPSSAQE
ncbi:MAG: metal ABC transporter permease [Fimbriimonadales bacterium]